MKSDDRASAAAAFLQSRSVRAEESAKESGVRSEGEDEGSPVETRDEAMYGKRDREVK